MGQGLGIAALVLLVLSVPIPIYGTYINFIALMIAAASALSGNKAFPISVVAVSAVKLFMMSPSWMLVMATTGSDWAPGFTLLMLALPAGALLIRFMMDSGSLSASDAGSSAAAAAQAIFASPPMAPSTSRPASSPTASETSDLSFWDGMADKNDPDLLMEYLIRFPTGRFAELAEVKLQRLGAPPLTRSSAVAPIEAVSPSAPAARPAACSACELPFEADANFCTGCGAPRGEAVPV